MSRLTGGRPFARDVARRILAAGATCDANPRRSLVAPVRSPTANSSRCAARRSKIGGHAPARAGDRSPASSPSAAAGAPDSPGPVLDVRGVPTPAPDRRRSTAGACPNRGWRGPQNQLGRVVARVTITPIQSPSCGPSRLTKSWRASRALLSGQRTRGPHRQFHEPQLQDTS